MQPLNRRQMAWRAAQDIDDGSLVNLGLGMPVAVADYLRPGLDVFIQSENGVDRRRPAGCARQRSTPTSSMPAARRITLRPGAIDRRLRPGRSP